MSTDDRRARLRELATSLRDDYRLKGRWCWSGWLKQEVHLQTSGNGGRFILGFARHGFQGAQPLFPHLDEGERHPRTRPGMEIPRFSVCHEATSPDDPRVYRKTIDGFRNPVAEYLAAADAETILGLLDEVDALRAQLAERESVTA